MNKYSNSINIHTYIHTYTDRQNNKMNDDCKSAPAETGVPENFKKVITDFISSFLTAFPEYEQGLHSNLCIATHAAEEIGDAAIAKLHEHCRTVYPERFFDILYQNDHIFSPESAVSNDVSVDFLPGIDFRVVWNLSDITETTKEHIWKHLQLITFTIVGSMSKGNLTFGDTAKMFEAINEEELRVKLEETMANLQSMFEPDARSDTGMDGATNPDATSPPPSSTSDALPDAESMHEHLSGLLGGKIGTLAKEIAEETVSELNIDVSEETSVSGVFQKLMKNPGKLAGIIKKVGEKLDKKMKSGDIKESELFKEASEFMNKMKAGGGGGKGGKGGKGGMGDLAQILKSMNLGGGDLGGLGGLGGLSGLGGKTKVNIGAMQSQLGRNMKMAQNKERLQRKLEERRAAALVAAAASTHQQQQQQQPPKEMKHSVYKPSDGESIEKTPRNPTNPANQNQPQSIEPPQQLTQNQKKKHKKS